MKPKTLITAVLLLFVAGGVVALVVKEFRRIEPEAEADGTIVHFFHGEKQCERCTNAKAYAEEAVRATFAEQLDDGRLKWRMVNYDQPQNRHFKEKYDLPVPMIMLVKIDGGELIASKGLFNTLLTADDKQACIDYVTEGVQEFLQENGG